MPQKPSHLISANQFTTTFQLNQFLSQVKWVSSICARDALQNKIMATLFYQPSTRTRLSFETAMHKFGGKVLSCEAASAFSSHVKGESLEDTMRTVSCYADVIVLRHDEKGAAKRASKHCKVHLINAGDGDGEHPTQALLDIYTIHQHFNKLRGLKIAMIGDLKYGRTVHSLIKLLAVTEGVTLIFSNLIGRELPDDVLNFIRSTKHIHYMTTYNLKDALSHKPDVVYMTRPQTDGEEYPDDMIFDKKKLDMLPKDSIILHPLPRRREISPEVDEDPRACYWKQVQNGVDVRKTVLYQMFESNPSWQESL